MATGYAALAAADVLDAGGTAQEAADAARARADASTSLFYVDTLEYLRRGGRIGAAAALLGGALAVKPLLTIQDGVVASLERVRTTGRALARLEELAVEAAADGGRRRRLRGAPGQPRPGRGPRRAGWPSGWATSWADARSGAASSARSSGRTSGPGCSPSAWPPGSDRGPSQTVRRPGVVHSGAGTRVVHRRRRWRGRWGSVAPRFAACDPDGPAPSTTRWSPGVSPSCPTSSRRPGSLVLRQRRWRPQPVATGGATTRVSPRRCAWCPTRRPIRPLARLLARRLPRRPRRCPCPAVTRLGARPPGPTVRSSGPWAGAPAWVRPTSRWSPCWWPSARW